MKASPLVISCHLPSSPYVHVGGGEAGDHTVVISRHLPSSPHVHAGGDEADDHSSMLSRAREHLRQSTRDKKPHVLVLVLQQPILAQAR